jgi:hypothetical protein
MELVQWSLINLWVTQGAYAPYYLGGRRTILWMTGPTPLHELPYFVRQTARTGRVMRRPQRPFASLHFEHKLEIILDVLERKAAREHLMPI